jgi:hypothetical protein
MRLQSQVKPLRRARDAQKAQTALIMQNERKNAIAKGKQFSKTSIRTR